MSLQQLEQILNTVPYLATLGISVEEARPGQVVLRLPALEGNTTHDGVLHSAAMFAVGEVAAGVAVGTQPQLVGYTHLLRGTRIRYAAVSRKDVTAHAAITPEMVEAIVGSESGRTEVQVPVRVMDGHGGDVAELIVSYSFRGG